MYDKDESGPMHRFHAHTFGLLSHVPGLVHAVFTRHGGVSPPPWNTLNVGWSCGDSNEAVAENLNRIRQVLGLRVLVAAPQIHGDIIHVVDEALLLGSESQEGLVRAPRGDALVTNLRGVGLLIKVADCQAVFLVDPVRELVANIHSGWRGTVCGLPEKVVHLMVERFGCAPGDLLATISPSLGPCCAEFKNYREELPPTFLPFQVRPRYFDFWAITRSQLMAAGLRPEHIEMAGRCTVCEAHDFFSYRGEGVTGRLAAVVGWKDKF